MMSLDIEDSLGRIDEEKHKEICFIEGLKIPSMHTLPFPFPRVFSLKWGQDSLGMYKKSQIPGRVSTSLKKRVLVGAYLHNC